MTTREKLGRVAHTVLGPLIRIALKNSRRSYVLIVNNDRILVVKNLLGSGKWHLPGGGCHKNESYEDAAVREVKEEVGVTLASSDLVPLTDNSIRSKREYDYRLYSVLVTEQIELKLDRREILETAWVLPAELNESNAGDSTLSAVQLSVANRRI